MYKSLVSNSILTEYHKDLLLSKIAHSCIKLIYVSRLEPLQALIFRVSFD